MAGPHCMACRILVPQPGIRSVPPAAERQSPDHWSAREVPFLFTLKNFRLCLVTLISKPYYLILPLLSPNAY